MEVTTVRAPGLGCPALWWGGARLGQWCSTEEGSDTGVGASDRREPWEHGGHPAPPMGPGPSSLPPGPRCCPGRGTVRGGEGCSGSRAAEALEAWGSEGGAQVPSSYLRASGGSCGESGHSGRWPGPVVAVWSGPGCL